MVKNILFTISIIILCITCVRVAVGVTEEFKLGDAIEYVSSEFGDTDAIKDSMNSIKDSINGILGRNVDGEIDEDKDIFERIWDVILTIYYVVVFLFEIIIMVVKDILVVLRFAFYIIFGTKL